jgi:hypothetical protein
MGLKGDASSSLVENQAVGTQLPFESDTAVGLAGALDLVSGIFPSGRQELRDDEGSAPCPAKEALIREADMLAAYIDMI